MCGRIQDGHELDQLAVGHGHLVLEMPAERLDAHVERATGGAGRCNDEKMTA